MLPPRTYMSLVVLTNHTECGINSYKVFAILHSIFKNEKITLHQKLQLPLV